MLVAAYKKKLKRDNFSKTFFPCSRKQRLKEIFQDELINVQKQAWETRSVRPHNIDDLQK